MSGASFLDESNGIQPNPPSFFQRGAAIHYGTWASAVYGLAHANELSSIRSKLYPQRLPAFQPKLKPR